MIKNPKSESFYPKLLQRLHERDTTLTKDDFRNLYYGFTLQKNYSPYSINPNEEEFQKYLAKDSLTSLERGKFIELANESLNNNPFDFRLLNILAFVHDLNGDQAIAKKIAFILNNLISTIISSGDGLSCETAFHVITINHEYVILSVFEVESQSQSLIGNCDYLRFEKGKYKVDGLYFDISKLMDSMLGKN